MTDPRISLLRPDLAPFDCEGLAFARGYGGLRRARIMVVATAIRAAADDGAEQINQLLFGEDFDVLRREGEFVWGQSRRDGYVGWVAARALSSDLLEPSHRLRAPRAAVLSAPNIRAPALAWIGMNALVAIPDSHGAFSLVAGLGWIASTQLAPIGAGFCEPAEAASMFVSTPYVWGARDGAGLDCSGLVQQALFAAGRSCPRDADQQAALGADVSPDNLRRGDLVAWRGHIGMMLDAENLIHANAHHMAVAIEPLVSAIERVDCATGDRPLTYRRLSFG